MNTEIITKLIESALPTVMSVGLQMVSAIAIFFVGRWIARLAKRFVKKIMTKAQVEPTLTSFACNILFYGIMAFVVLGALGNLGIETTSLVAVLGAAGSGHWPSTTGFAD